MSVLVSYSSSSEDSDSDNHGDNSLIPPAKKLCKEESAQSRDILPLPKDLLLMFNDEELEDVDSKDHHMGRTRSFEHVPGNWATYLYIPFECDSRFSQCLELLRDYLTDQYPVSAGHAEFHVIPSCGLHVTVSRTVAIRHHWIEPLMNKLRNGITKHNSFRYQLSDLEVYCNDAKTRSFFGLEIIFGHDNVCEKDLGFCLTCAYGSKTCTMLLQLVEAIDDEFEQFNLPKYYEEPSFHLSTMWCLGDLQSVFHKTALRKMQGQWNKLLHQHGLSVLAQHPATEVHCKCGNKCFKFSLKS